MGQTTRSTDPRRHTPQFREYQERCTIRALDDMQLQSKKQEIPPPAITYNDYLSDSSSNQYRHMQPRPPTPSQKRLGEEGEVHWDGIQVDDSELEGTADDSTKGEESSRSNRLYTQEELVVLTRKIFGDEDEEDDGQFCEADGATWAAIDHPAKDEGAGVDHQNQENDIEGQSGESKGKANEESRLHGLFGPTSNVSLSAPSEGGLPRSPQDEGDGRLCKMYWKQRQTQLPSTHRMA